MNFKSKLRKSWKKSHSLVCVGLDPLISKIPISIRERKKPIFEFNKAIIDYTADLVCAFKPQIAYFSAQRAEEELEQTIDYINKNYPDIPVILDAKRSDMAATPEQYATEVFDRYKADAVTVVPFQGTDAIKPYLDRKDKGVIILCKTSNDGSSDLQDLVVKNESVYQVIAQKAVSDWNYNNNVSLVVGGTYPEVVGEIRKKVADIPLLVPGIGQQGGDLAKCVRLGQDSTGAGMLLSSSRSIIYASSGEDFAARAREVVVQMNDKINESRKSCFGSEMNN